LDDDTYREPSAQEQEDSFLTPKDLQRELKIGTSLTYRLLKSGAVPSLRVGGVYRIRRSELDRLTANSSLENA
jgi:excisionase family DNA binding protein